ncbi:hypothetical protein BDV33DRAFT_56656 [Aspergillus novoparasiticus]|uniref:Uncharacterized protein n=1 Tax=Aspergillus novoparasiticus TaxID=986946 RepID=A0A5N6EZ16_9EURO|nr:hypothetical protein BDV33DRAFT_56656 [Aspergillus novoparasiticus]
MRFFGQTRQTTKTFFFCFLFLFWNFNVYLRKRECVSCSVSYEDRHLSKKGCKLPVSVSESETVEEKYKNIFLFPFGFLKKRFSSRNSFNHQSREMLKAKLCDLYQAEVWRDRGRGEGGEKTTVWRSGAVPRPGSKIPRASESGRLGLYIG